MGLTYNKETNEARFQYTNREGDRKVVYLGKIPKREADRHETFLFKLLASHLSPSVAIGKDTADYLKELPKRIKQTLIKHGLIVPTAEEARDRSLSFGELREKFLDFHKEDKPNTHNNIRLACNKLIERLLKAFGWEKIKAVVEEIVGEK